ncbi:MAG: hypothetical protein ABN482_01650 [Corticimicrobacter sp.]|uniref:hypothetical protein n=1 Tax=Corticimicrobacter sp. TaxID=2678536 RepID=UPI0032DA734D
MSHTHPPLSFPKISRQGFVYEADIDQPAHIGAATIGQIITQEDAPPYIVVDHHIDNVLPTRWPGRLWHVRILAVALDQPASYANYTRATSIEVCDALSPALLFGPQGDAVSKVQDLIPHLTLAQIEHLAQHATPAAEAGYEAAWGTWLEQTDPASKQPGMQYAGVLAMGNGLSRSPLGHAFTLAHAQYCKRVRALAGSDAFEADEDGDEWLRAPWSEALTTLLSIIMGLGAPHLSSAENTVIMTTAWFDLPA